jgi:outer membrane protein assembly factor BamB
VHISVHCPSCGSQYQVDPGLRGLRMRCPNPACRQVFQVWDEPELASRSDGDEPIGLVPIEEDYPPARRPQPPAEKPRKAGSGAVGDIVPILDAEIAEEPAPPPSRGGSSTPPRGPTAPAEKERRSGPHRERRSARERRSDSGTAAPPRAQPETAPPTEPGRAAEPLPAWHSPPPVRRLGAASGEPAAPEPVVEVAGDEPPRPEEPLDLDLALRPSTGRRRALWLVGTLVVVGGLVIGIVTAIALNTLGQREMQLARQAQEKYDKGAFASAAAEFHKLAEEFPRSDIVPFYHFMEDLSQVREYVSSLELPSEAQSRVERFLNTYNADPLLRDHVGDIQETLLKLAGRLTESADQQLDADLLAHARKALDERKKFLKEGPTNDDKALLEKLTKVEATVARRNKHDLLVKQLNIYLAEGKPTVDTVRKARDLVEDEGFDQDQELNDRIRQLEENVRALVRYVPSPQPALAGPPPSVTERGFVVVPHVGGNARPAGLSGGVVLALVQGVLYALDRNSGDWRWAARVGIDTTTLPVRLPSTPSSPELFLVLSADGNMLMALAAEDGSIRWRQALSAPCLGRPVVVGQYAYVPTYDGRVQEIETAKGALLGYFELRQPLSMGGAWQEGTDLIYVPGDSDNLYVLNTAALSRRGQKRCVAVLHTGHPSGSLRSEPIIVNRTDPFARGNAVNQATFPSYLILNQADGLDQMKLRVFALPIERSDAPGLLQPEPRVSGWSWFPPYHDSEKLAFVTDVGVLGLYGINQVRNEDPALFSQFKDEYPLIKSAASLGRAQVVHAVENDFWIVANGELQRFHFDLYRQQVLKLWPNPLPVGLPVHAAQSDDAGRTLFLVSQDPGQQIYRATAIETETGKVVWQRQLGLEIQGDPVRMGNQVLAHDHGGGLFNIDPAKATGEQTRGWQVLDTLAGGPLTGGAIQSYLLPTDDGTAAFQISCPEQGKELTVRKYHASAESAAPAPLEQRRFKLGAPLVSPPALGPQNILLATDDGVVLRLTLPFDEPMQLESGPNWRSARADEGARGYVVAISADEFLTTDGSSGLTHWRWPQGMTFTAVLPNAEIPATVEMPARIVARPLVLPKAGGDGELQVCVATYGGSLALLAGAELKQARTWSLGGTLTAGPFLRGQYVCCVMDRSRLVWIDPNQDNVYWDHKVPGAGIVGQPQQIDGWLVVADSSGQVLAFDPRSRRQVGSAYTLKTSAAAAGTPVAFEAGKALVPLTDGTLFLLDLQVFGMNPAAGQPGH